MTPISACRACGSAFLVTVLDLGAQHLTGVFPDSGKENPPAGPLQLLWCSDCTLLQLSMTFPQTDMYGENYGYRSGLNASMVHHLSQIARRVEESCEPTANPVFLDIGSNDGTLLSHIHKPGAVKIGIDPTSAKFLDFYPEDVTAVPDFFSAEAFMDVAGRPADVVTAVSMFYDLPEPVAFAREVASILAPDGILLLEQSYLPSMLRTTSYDTICHEHIEYYSLATIEGILSQAGLRLLDVAFNRVNGGSFAITAARENSDRKSDDVLLPWFRAQEARWALDTPEPFREFERKVYLHRRDLQSLIQGLVAAGNSVMGLGASTKGNVLLQFCDLGPELVSCIGEVNPEKFGKVTPGTRIPIVSEQEVRSARPDYLLVLPWHFREGIIAREREFLEGGGKLIFPLPEIEIVGD